MCPVLAEAWQNMGSWRVTRDTRRNSENDRRSVVCGSMAAHPVPHPYNNYNASMVPYPGSVMNSATSFVGRNTGGVCQTSKARM